MKIAYDSFLTGIELDVVGDLAGGNIDLHGVVGVDQGIRVADGATVVCHQERHSLGAQLVLLDLAQLVLQRRIRNVGYFKMFRLFKDHSNRRRHKALYFPYYPYIYTLNRL